MLAAGGEEAEDARSGEEAVKVRRRAAPASGRGEGGSTRALRRWGRPATLARRRRRGRCPDPDGIGEWGSEGVGRWGLSVGEWGG